jgi:adenine specific DNA methylase Mod
MELTVRGWLFGASAHGVGWDTLWAVELTWTNKDKGLLSLEDGGYEWVEPGDPRTLPGGGFQLARSIGEVTGEVPGNLLINASCLSALRALGEVSPYKESFAGKVKLIYLDPPFNASGGGADYPDLVSHEMWLSLFRETMLASKPLLHPEGSIWVHLDDIEQHRARVIMDEVYGEEAFVATLIWENFWKVHAHHALSRTHNYIHIYAPAGEKRWAGVRNLLENPGSEGDLLPRTLWRSMDVGNFSEAKAEAGELFPGEETFSTPKPERLLARIIHIATNPGDIVIDPYSGSGTTAAVAHKMGRAWVTIDRERRTIESYTLPRLEKVVSGEDQGGVSKELGWAGGGSFSYVVG